MRRPKSEPSPSRQELAARLRFTDADLKAFAFVPPGPEPVEVLAERGITWAQQLLEARAAHSTGGHFVSADGYCGPCQRYYARPKAT